MAPLLAWRCFLLRRPGVDPQRPLVIVNPRAGGGLNEARWAKLVGPLTAGLGPFDAAFTTAGGHAVLLAHEAAVAGRRLIVALGGDGTISEAANGILAAGAGATTELGIIPRGTGGDFRRMLQLSQTLAEAARHVREKPAHAIDVGRVTFTAHDGSPALRYFVNVASFGFSSAVASKANASSKRLGGKLAFLGATLRTLATYDNSDVWLGIDGAPQQRRRVLMAAVGNGRFFGGGMKICPSATLDSGRLDLVVVGDLGRMEVLAKVGRIYGGSHLTLNDVRNDSIMRLQATPVEASAMIPLELDGETPGRLPALFEVVPGALRVRF